LSGIQLEYWDRFNWSGTWDDFDASLLLRKDSVFVVPGWRSWRRQWHSHAGWFEPVDNLRRLTNINVDVGEVPVARPSVVVYTTLQDHIGIQGYGETDPALDQRFVLDRLDVLHGGLKALLGTVITEEIVERIGLQKE
jgi:uncharacterized protein (TIGR04255 family)